MDLAMHDLIRDRAIHVIMCITRLRCLLSTDRCSHESADWSHLCHASLLPPTASIRFQRLVMTICFITAGH